MLFSKLKDDTHKAKSYRFSNISSLCVHLISDYKKHVEEQLTAIDINAFANYPSVKNFIIYNLINNIKEYAIRHLLIPKNPSYFSTDDEELFSFCFNLACNNREVRVLDNEMCGVIASQNGNIITIYPNSNSTKAQPTCDLNVLLESITEDKPLKKNDDTKKWKVSLTNICKDIPRQLAPISNKSGGDKTKALENWNNSYEQYFYQSNQVNFYDDYLNKANAYRYTNVYGASNKN